MEHLKQPLNHPSIALAARLEDLRLLDASLASGALELLSLLLNDESSPATLRPLGLNLPLDLELDTPLRLALVDRLLDLLKVLPLRRSLELLTEELLDTVP